MVIEPKKGFKVTLKAKHILEAEAKYGQKCPGFCVAAVAAEDAMAEQGMAPMGSQIGPVRSVFISKHADGPLREIRYSTPAAVRNAFNAWDGGESFPLAPGTVLEFKPLSRSNTQAGIREQTAKEAAEEKERAALGLPPREKATLPRQKKAPKTARVIAYKEARRAIAQQLRAV